MTQHCHETVKKALMWATEAATPHTTLLFIHPHHSSFYSHALFLPPTHSPFKAAWTHGCRSRRCLLHVPGNPKPDATPALAPSARPKQELQVWTSLTPSPALLLHSRGITRHIWAATASLLQRIMEMEGEDSDSLYDFGLHPFWLMVFPLQPCVLQADMVTLTSVWAKQFANQLHCHSTIHN